MTEHRRTGFARRCACVAVLFAGACTIAQAEEKAGMDLHIGDGSGWRFPAGAWAENAQGVITPPDKRNLHSRAFNIERTFEDLTAEFDFNCNYREKGSGLAGLILRAADANHFYLVYFPWQGQSLRAKHFWAAVAKVDGDGYLRNIKAVWVPGVTSEVDRWYKAKVVAEGSRISVWVDGRFALTVSDDSYRSGLVGLAGYGWYLFRNIRINGTQFPAPEWNEQEQIPTHAFELPVTSTMPSGGIAPNGDVLLLCGSQILRSNDKGRTWAKEALPQKLHQTRRYASNTLHCMKNGRVIIYTFRSPEPPYPKPPAPEIFISESKDNGLTWSDPTPSKVTKEGYPEANDNLFPYGPRRPYGTLVETEDGALVSLLIGSSIEEGDKYTDVQTWGAIHAKGYSIRSTDGGASWSGPVDLDGVGWAGQKRGTYPGTLDFTEATGVAIGNTITVLVRPIYSPMMWQCWSYDGGVSWDAAVRATFPGYAQSMLRLKSGPILCAHRYFLYSINVSYDNGVNWDPGTVVDYPNWAMGFMVEVEPDVVLCTYMNAETNRPLLGQLIRVTSDGLVPLPLDK